MKMQSGSIVQLRSTSEDPMNRTKQRLKDCEKDLRDARRIIDDTSKAMARLELESSQLRRDVDALRQQLEIETLARTDLDNQLKAKVEEFSFLNDRDNEIDRLASEKAALLLDYQGLMDNEVALDSEIDTYRKLLDGEEKRLSLSPKITRTATPREERRGTLVLVVKRKRGVLDEELELESAAQYDTNTICNGGIEISEDGPEGKFIRLRNKSDKEVSISGWQLIRPGDIDTTHKFDSQAKIDAGGTMIVWSSDATEAVHEPLASIMMKGQKRCTSEHFKTVLGNAEVDEQAIRETRRLQVSRQRKRLGFGQPEELFQQESGERVERERCVIL